MKECEKEDQSLGKRGPDMSEPLREIRHIYSTCTWIHKYILAKAEVCAQRWSWHFYWQSSKTVIDRILSLNLQPDLRKCWDIFNLNTIKTKWLSNHMIITIEYCLNWEILHFYPLNELISNLIPATGLKKVGTGATKSWKSKTFGKDSAGRTSSN